jgi:hypothetical protein
MTHVTIFTRRNTTDRWLYIAKRLEFADRVTIIGLLDDGCDLNLMSSFYSYYRAADNPDFARSVLGEDVCNDIIQRCRLLRNQSRSVALASIGAMWRAIEEALDRLQPDILLSFLVDFYPADILERLVRQRGIKFIGLSAGILKNTVTFSALGEYIYVREPAAADIQSALAEIGNPTFAPSVKTDTKYNFSRFAKAKLFWNARHALLSATHLLKGDPLNPEYKTTSKPGDDYYVRWQDWQLVNYLHQDWEQTLDATPFEKRVFVGLQYNPECSTDYWVRDLRLADWIASLTEVAKVLTANGFTVFVKDHPVMFGLRRKEIYERLKDIDRVIFIPYEVRSQVLIDRCKTTFTWTGTIGIQAALAGRCPVVSTTYYRTPQDFIYLDTWEDIATLPEKIDRFQLPDTLDAVRQRVLYQLCSSSVPASTNWTKFDPQTSDLSGTQMLIDSLNLYLPQFAKTDLDKVGQTPRS